MLGLKGFDLRMGVGFVCGVGPMAALSTLTLALSHRGRGDFPGTPWHPAPLDSGFRRNDVNVRVDIDGNSDNSEVWCYGT